MHKIISINPTTEQSIGRVEMHPPEALEDMMQRLEQAFYTWRCVPAPKRGEIVRQIGDALRVRKSELGQLITQEMGKSIQEAEGEVQEMIDMADFAVGQSRMLYGNTLHSERPEHRMYEQWHPYGIVGIITAFNFPVAVWAWNAFLAIICGNVCLWKPSSKTPLCAVAVHDICLGVLRKNQSPDIFALFFPESRQSLAIMVEDSRIPLISFTGSTPVGKEVARQVAGRLGRSILELGGNNAIILDASAQLDLAIPAIVFGAVGTAGQRCTSTRRLLVHQSIYDQVIKKLQHAYKQLRIGDPIDPQNHVGPLIDEKAVHQFEAKIQQLKQKGWRILAGGNKIKRKGYFVEPTLVEGIAEEQHLIYEETFAPILTIFSYTSLEQAIKLHNAVPQGLSSALFTTQLKQAEYFLSTSGSDCGIANINIGTSGAEIGGAFGGEKATGGGREAGSDAWKSYMRRQTTTINWGEALPLAQGIVFKL